jgi:hypothetical protein
MFTEASRPSTRRFLLLERMRDLERRIESGVSNPYAAVARAGSRLHKSILAGIRQRCAPIWTLEAQYKILLDPSLDSVRVFFIARAFISIQCSMIRRFECVVFLCL